MAVRAKVVGITLITSTNMPLGRDGPMVHIGAMCAAILTRAKIPGTAKLLDLRLPAPQRECVACPILCPNGRASRGDAARDSA